MQTALAARPPDTAQICPKCGATIPVYEGFVTWCDRCGWNLQPVRPPAPRNVVKSVYASMGRRLSDQLYVEVAAAPSLRPHVTLALVLAYLIAALVHALTLLLVVGGIFLISGSWGYWLIVAVGVVALGVAWLLRPRIPRLLDDERAGLIARADFPALYGLVDQVAAAVGRPPVDYLVVDGRYNAAFGAVGWRWRKLLILGLPLFTI